LQEKVRFSGSEGVRWDKVGNKPDIIVHFSVEWKSVRNESFRTYRGPCWLV